MEGFAKKHSSSQPGTPEDYQNVINQYTKMHSRNIKGMISQILEKIFVSHAELNKVNEVKKLIYSQMFLKSVIICASEVQFYIYNVKELKVYNLIELVNQPPFDLWRILNIFLKLYQDMPYKIQTHFREIEIRIICELAWKRGSSVIRILDYMKN